MANRNCPINNIFVVQFKQVIKITFEKTDLYTLQLFFKFFHLFLLRCFNACLILLSLKPVICDVFINIEFINRGIFMIFSRKLFAYLVTFLLLLAPLGHAGEDGWETLGESKKVTGFVKAIPGTSLKAFKGVTEIEASLEKVYWVISNNNEAFRKEWVGRLETSKTLEIKTKHERITYGAFDLPWPISDRDYVYHVKATRKDKNIFIAIKSTLHDKAPKTVGVRAHLNNSNYVLEPLGDNKTKVTVEIHTDPKGLLPAWLVNIIQKNWPVKTLNGIRKQTAKFSGEKVTLP
jgi:hypothetical protein